MIAKCHIEIRARWESESASNIGLFGIGIEKDERLNLVEIDL